jgi:hypothetical protein
MRLQDCGGDHTGFFSDPGFRGVCSEIAQDSDAPLPHDPLGDFVHCAQHAANSAGAVGHGAIGNREMRFLDESGTIDLKLNVLAPCRRTALRWRVN